MRLKSPPTVTTVLFLIFASLSIGFTGPALGDDAKTLRVALSAFPSKKDPVYTSDIWSQFQSRQLFEGLYTTDRTGNLVLGLAKSISVSTDGLTYQIQLRTDSRWSNGDPVTAHDFALSLKRLVDPNVNKSFKANYLVASIQNAKQIFEGEMTLDELAVRVVSDHLLEIVLEAPNPLLPQILNHGALSPTPSKEYERHGENWALQTPMVSNGPFFLVDVERSEDGVTGIAEFQKNPHYHAARNIYFDKIRMLISPERDEVALFANNEIDIITEYRGFGKSWLTQAHTAHRIDANRHFTTYLVYNMKDQVTADIRVRLALSLVVDNSEIAGRIDQKFTPAISFAPEDAQAKWHPKPIGGSQLTFETRRTQAMDLLSAAGYSAENPLKIRFALNKSDTNMRLHQAIIERWQAIGVQVETDFFSVGEHYDRLDAGNFQVARAGWAQDVSDPSDFLNMLSSWHVNNVGKWDNPRYNELLDQLQATSDKLERADIFGKLEALVAEHVPVQPIFHNGETLIARNSLKVPVYNAVNGLPLQFVHPLDQIATE